MSLPCQQPSPSRGGNTVPHCLALCCSCLQVKPGALGEALKASPQSWWQCWAGEELWWCEPRDKSITQYEPCESCHAIVGLFLQQCRKTCWVLSWFSTELCRRLWRVEFLINVFKKLKEGKGDEDSYGVERATGSYHVAPSFHFVSLTTQYPAFPVSWAPQVVAILCRRCWGLPLARKWYFSPCLFHTGAESQ